VIVNGRKRPASGVGGGPGARVGRWDDEKGQDLRYAGIEVITIGR